MLSLSIGSARACGEVSSDGMRRGSGSDAEWEHEEEEGRKWLRWGCCRSPQWPRCKILPEIQGKVRRVYTSQHVFYKL